MLKQLTGLTAAQYAALLAELGPRWEEARWARLSARERRREVGGGRKPFPFAGRLLLASVQLRWNLPYRTTAALFGVSKDTVARAVAELAPLLAECGITAPDGTRVRDAEDLRAQLAKPTDEHRAALLDGSFVPVGRPKSWEDQKPLYSSHRHRHTQNFQAVGDDGGRLLWVGGVVAGGVHDLTALADSEAAGPLAAAGAAVVADKGYAGVEKRLGLKEAFTPKRRRRKKTEAPPPEVTEATKACNTEVARQRVPIEHAFGRLKTFRVLRGWRGRRHDRLADIVRAVAVLTTLPA